MKFKVLLMLISITTLSFGALIEQWEFGPSNNLSSITTYDYNFDNDTNTVIETARHIGGPTPTAGAYTGWDARATQGATLGTPAEGSTRFGSTQAGILNGYYGPSNFKGVPWVAPDAQPPAGYLTNGYYVASAANEDVVTITLKVTDIDWDQTTGNSGNNANFSFRLWDKATGILNEQAGGPANTYWMGLTVMDSYNQDRLQLALMSSNGTILSGGTGLTSNKNRTRIAWLGSGGQLAISDDWTFELEIYLNTGVWKAYVNEAEEATASGTFDTNHLKGFDRYQATFQQFSANDYIDIDEISVGAISTAGSNLLEPVGGYYTTVQDGATVLHDSLGDIFHTNGNIMAKFANISGVSTWNWTNNVQFVGVEAPYVDSTETVVGTNAAAVTSAWLANEAASVTLPDGTRGFENKFGVLRNNEDLFVSPADNSVVSLNNNITALNIDSVVNLASISGNSTTSADPEGTPIGAELYVNTGGTLNVLGQSVHSGQTYRDGSIEIGGWGQGEGTHHMTLTVDGGAVNAELIRVAHSKSGGTLNVDNGGSVNVTDLVLGFDAHKYGVGTVNINDGDITADTVFVGRANEGILNIAGGALKINSEGRVRIGDSRNNTTTAGPVLWSGSSNLVAKGTVNLTDGEISAADGATNTMLWVGYQDNDTTPKIMANFNISGGVVNGGENLQMQVGRLSPGTMTLSGTGVVNAGTTFTVGHRSDGILNVNGGTFNLTDNSNSNITTRLDIGGHGGGGDVGGNGVVNMTAGSMNLASLYMSNSQTDGNQTSSFNQTGGTVTIKGGACRLGVRGDATYTIGGGESLASLLVNPGNEFVNVSGNSNSTINLSYGAASDGVYKDSTLTINSNGFVHCNNITMESVNGAGDDDSEATLNLNGGTLLIEGNWNGGIALTNNATLNIGEGELIWAHWMQPLGEYLKQAWTNGHINLTGGITEVPSNSVAILTDGDYTLYGESYNSSNKVYSSEKRVDSTYSRFVSVLADPPSPYENWATGLGITDPNADADSDGIANLLEFALGTDPNVSDGDGISSARSGANITFTHPKRDGIDHGLTYTVQTNGNLKFGSWGDHSAVDSSEAGSSVTHTISTVSEDELFIRLKVETE